MTSSTASITRQTSHHTPIFKSRMLSGLYKAWRLVRMGRPDLLISVPLYRLNWRMRGLDFGVVSIEDLGLDPDLANYHKDGGGPLLRDLLNKLPITSNDAVLDMGSGKGGAMATMAKYPFSAVDGVEISAELCDAAQKNITKLNLQQCHVFHADATKFTDLDKYTYLFFFNPFPEVVLQQVLANLDESLRRAPRTVRLVYSNPLHEKAIAAAGTFERTFVYQPYDDYVITVYTNRSN